MAQIDLGEMRIDVVRKAIKNLHLSVLPPLGKVRVAAPRHMSLDTIRVFVISKLSWIRSQQRKIQSQEREAPREYLDRESHYVWGKRYLLKIVELEAPPRVELKHKHLVLQVRPGCDGAKRQAILDDWYRATLRQALVPLLEHWQPLVGVEAKRIFVQKMKTRWGSCNPKMGSIRFNTELAKKPQACLEYILVHELVHLIEPTHNVRFRSLMDMFMGRWEFHRGELNRLPVSHEDWRY